MTLTFDLWKPFQQLPPHMIICGKYHWNHFIKYRDTAHAKFCWPYYDLDLWLKIFTTMPIHMANICAKSSFKFLHHAE